MAERKRMAAPAAVGALLDATFHDTPLAHRLAEARIWELWDRVVGPQVAANARPQTIRDGVLTVLVANAPWMQQLNFLKTEISGSLNRALGSNLVRDLYLKAGRPSRGAQQEQHSPLPDRELNASELAAITSTVATISDTDLRDACQRLLTTHHRRH